MKLKTLHCDPSKKSIFEVEWNKPEPADDEVEVQTVYCGICRSDIGNFIGAEAMPYSNADNPNGIIGTWGHEGLGIVTKVGKNLKGEFKKGDAVSTCSDPAYSPFYNSQLKDTVKIPELDYKYIVQPVACSINIIQKTRQTAGRLGIDSRRILLIGSGFMSLVIARYLKSEKHSPELIVVGNSMKSKWKELGIDLISDINDVDDDSFDIVIDLSSKGKNFEHLHRITKREGLISYAATPYDKVTTNFFENCWKCHTFIMPSPRNSDFREMMIYTIDLIWYNRLKTDDLWTGSYNRNNMDDVLKGFKDGSARTEDYIRGYLKF